MTVAPSSGKCFLNSGTWAKNFLVIEILVGLIFATFLGNFIDFVCHKRPFTGETTAQQMNHMYNAVYALFFMIAAFLLHTYTVFTLCAAVFKGNVDALCRWMQVRATIAALGISWLLAYFLVFDEISKPLAIGVVYCLSGLIVNRIYKKAIMATKTPKFLLPVNGTTFVKLVEKDAEKVTNDATPNPKFVFDGDFHV